MRFRIPLAVLWVVIAAFAIACGDDDDDGVRTVAPATIPATETVEPSATTVRNTPVPRTPGAAFTQEEAEALLAYALLQPDDITSPGWVIQSDDITDNATADAANPDLAASNERCGRLLARTITNFPPDVTGNYIGGLTVSYFSTATVYETGAGAADCSAEAAARLAQPCELARTFGGVFKDPCAVVVTPVEAPTVADGAIAFTLAGKSDAGGLEIDLTILAVAFTSDNVTAVVGSAGASAPSTEDLSPYVDLVAERIEEAQ
jgi:hypothetical protein